MYYIEMDGHIVQIVMFDIKWMRDMKDKNEGVWMIKQGRLTDIVVEG